MRRTDTLRGALHARSRLLALIMFVAILAACGQGSSGAAPADLDASLGRGVVDSEAADEAGAGGEEAASGGGPQAPEPNALPAEQRIIKTGEIAIEVDRVATALARVRALAVELGGYVGDSQAGTLDQSATVTLRIPANRFGDALIALRAGRYVADR
jgi:hypothetical protein